MDGTAAPGTSALYSRGDHVHPSDTSRYAASNPSGYVTSAGAASAAPVQSVNTRTGAVVINSTDVTTALTFTPYNATNPSGYQTAAQVTTALTPYATLAAPVFTGDARAVTPAAGDADTSIATTAFVAAAVPNINYADNSGFTVNQRAGASGTALSAGIFGHDRWKAGAGGGTYTYTALAGPANTITITAGTLQQVIEGACIIGGNYMLSWTGTAQGRVGAGSYAASPISVAGITAGANTTIEFNAGTLSRVKFEAGTVATPWQALAPVDELQRCQRFYQIANWQSNGYVNAASVAAKIIVTMPTTMRAPPSVNISGTPAYVNCSAATPGVWDATNFEIQVTGTAAGMFSARGVYTATADL